MTTDGGDAPDLAIDPVTGERFPIASAYASVEHDGRTYHVRSRASHDAFLASPHRYGHRHAPDDPRPALDEITGP